MKSLESLRQTIGGVLRPSESLATESGARPLGPVVIDSRQVTAGDVFWGLPGRRHDGAEFAEEAFARGAAGAVVTRSIPAPADRWVLTVDDAEEALWQWAAWNRQQFSGTMIGVSGSVGKTTTCRLIHTILGTRLRGAAGSRNCRGRLALPLSLTAIEADHDYAIVELDGTRPGELAALAELVRPAIGTITDMGEFHLGSFNSARECAESKAELAAALPGEGHAVLGDDPWLRRVAESSAPITWVGCRPGCGLLAEDVDWRPGEMNFRIGGIAFRVPIWGRHHLTSALAAIAVARLMGIELDESARALETYCTVPAHCDVLEVRGATIITDSEDESLEAVRAALKMLRDFDAPGRRIVVCGDLCDSDSDAILLHRRLGEEVVTGSGADLLIACGEHAWDVVGGARAAGMKPRHAIPCRVADETLPYLGQAVVPGDVVLVKGSRALAIERIVDALAHYPKRRTA